MFKSVPGFLNYSIDETGRVKNGERFITTGTFNTGYARVALYKDGKAWSKSVHRLVAEAFLPNPENKPQVNHKDGNKLNNNVDNLEWVTGSENIQHALRTGLLWKFTKFKVQCVETGEVYDSCLAAGKACGAPDGNIIARHLKGGLASAYKKHWIRIE